MTYGPFAAHNSQNFFDGNFKKAALDYCSWVYITCMLKKNLFLKLALLNCLNLYSVEILIILKIIYAHFDPIFSLRIFFLNSSKISFLCVE